MKFASLPILSLSLLLTACGSVDETREQRLAQAGPNPSFEALMKVASAEVGKSKFRQCAACHHIKAGAADIGGPNLYGIVGQPLATNSSRFGYTAALRDHGGVWDEKTLDRWLENPRKMIPATTMNFAGISDPLSRADIIAYMREQKP